MGNCKEVKVVPHSQVGNTRGGHVGGIGKTQFKS
jgi:hypothetical protein